MSGRRNQEVAVMSKSTADVLFGGGLVDPSLELGALLGFARWASELDAIDQRDLSRAQILAEIERTMAALEAYPRTPVLPALRLDDVALPDWSSL